MQRPFLTPYYVKGKLNTAVCGGILYNSVLPDVCINIKVSSINTWFSEFCVKELQWPAPSPELNTKNIFGMDRSAKIAQPQCT